MIWSLIQMRWTVCAGWRERSAMQEWLQALDICAIVWSRYHSPIRAPSRQYLIEYFMEIPDLSVSLRWNRERQQNYSEWMRMQIWSRGLLRKSVWERRTCCRKRFMILFSGSTKHIFPCRITGLLWWNWSPNWCASLPVMIWVLIMYQEQGRMPIIRHCRWNPQRHWRSGFWICADICREKYSMRDRILRNHLCRAQKNM